MKILMFYHSVYSDWNHGNAHFLRGMVKSLQRKGHEVIVYEPAGGWSLQNLLKNYGAEKLDEFRKYYPSIHSEFYNSKEPLRAEKIFEDADLVIVHEWNDPIKIEEIGSYKDKYGFKLLFHDTHHRAVSDPAGIDQFNLENYDGALVFGQILKDIYLQKKWVKQAYIWHEAADADFFVPLHNNNKIADLVWIGNWGDEERSNELREFLINPVKELGLKAKIFGVRYPTEVIEELNSAGIEYGGWLPNYKVPQVFSQYRLTVHVPRRPYTQMLPGIPTIRPFEAMSCGIPLISAPWNDAENLFKEGRDYLTAKDGTEMKEKIKAVLDNDLLADSLARNGRETIIKKHSCDIRATELEKIVENIEQPKKHLKLTT